MKHIIETLISIFGGTILGILATSLHHSNNNKATRKRRAINSISIIKNISNDLDKYLNNSKYITKNTFYTDIEYLNTWSEYILEGLMDNKIIKENLSINIKHITLDLTCILQMHNNNFGQVTLVNNMNKVMKKVIHKKIKERNGIYEIK